MGKFSGMQALWQIKIDRNPALLVQEPGFSDAPRSGMLGWPPETTTRAVASVAGGCASPA